jgi:dimethylhistidine N-methyltransferase
VTIAAARCTDACPEDDVVLGEVLAGLAERPKRLPCKLFYDDAGSRLFERICELDEYYLTRTELGILHERAREIARIAGAGRRVVEFGSGASVKTRILLDALERPASYVPIDIARAALLESSAALARDYPALEVHPVCADYTHEVVLPKIAPGIRTLGFFPGSTLGNFEPRDAVTFLRRVRAHCGSGGLLLIGVDLKKSPATLEAAYDDARGVTAEFNKNILRVINRRLGARFPLDAFRHRALYDERRGRVEMHLVSTIRQRVAVADAWVRFEPGEPIVTEHCYKYDFEGFCGLARASGFEPASWFTDDRALFAVALLEVRSAVDGEVARARGTS